MSDLREIDNLDTILDDHERWLETDGKEGRMADLRMADLRRADLREANLREANLRWANLHEANLREANLRKANLRRANLRWANLRWANLRKADLRRANLRWADLREADLWKADLWRADLRWADLSQSRGAIPAREWMEEHFEAAPDGYIAYKMFGYHQDPPEAWTIEEGAVIEEVVNPCRTIDCACGVNVGTKEWVDRNVHGEVWKVLIRWRWLPDVVVPYGTDGKIRCGKAELLEVVGGQP